MNIAYFPIIRHTKVRMDANPYFDTQLWTSALEEVCVG